MTVENLLNVLIESIAVTFTIWMAIDFAIGLSQLGLPDYPKPIVGGNIGFVQPGAIQYDVTFVNPIFGCFR